MGFTFDKYKLDGAGGASGGGIIDVVELPTENIDEGALYRATSATMWMAMEGQLSGMPVNTVDTLPETATPGTYYYVVGEDRIYARAADSFTDVVSIGITYGGIVPSESAIDPNVSMSVYIVLSSTLYYYCNGWMKVTTSPKNELSYILKRKVFDNLEAALNFAYTVRPFQCYAAESFSFTYEGGETVQIPTILKSEHAVLSVDTAEVNNAVSLYECLGSSFKTDPASSLNGTVYTIGRSIQTNGIHCSAQLADGTIKQGTFDLSGVGKTILYYFG